MPSIGEAYEAQAADVTLGEHWSGPPVLVDRVAAAAGTAAGQRILDVGCGAGGPARRLGQLGCLVLAVDLVAGLVREAARRTSNETIQFAVGDALALPAPSASFDQVWCLGALAHIGDVDGFARQVHDVLRPAGSLALTDAFWWGTDRPRSQATAPKPWRPVRLARTVEALSHVGLTPTAHPWPALDVPGALEAADPLLRSDLAARRLIPALVVATKGRG